jgi:hypothetical protein
LLPRHSNNWLEEEPTSRFGLSSELVTVFWRGEGSAAGKFAEAKNYSHSRIAYPRFGPESMAPMRESVLPEILPNGFVTIPLPSWLDEPLQKKDASIATLLAAEGRLDLPMYEASCKIIVPAHVEIFY